MVIIPKIRFEQLRATRAISEYVSVRRTATANGSYYDGALDRLVRRLVMLRRQLAWARSVECLRSHCRCRGRPSGVWWGTQSERTLHWPCRKTATRLVQGSLRLRSSSHPRRSPLAPQCDRKHSTDRAHASCRRSIANLRTSRSSAPS